MVKSYSYRHDANTLVTVKVAHHGDEPYPSAITIESTDLTPVTGARIRSVPIGRYVTESLSSEAGELPADWPEDRLAAVAAAYSAARRASLPPQKFVMQQLDLPRSTAGWYIARARRLGLIT